MGTENKKPYSDALINCSVPRKMIAACPLAFGAVGVKGRVKSVLNYKKPAFWMILAATISCVVIAVCFLTNPKTTNRGKPNPNPNEQFVQQHLELMDQYPEYFGLDASNGLDVYVWQMAKDNYSFGLLPHADSQRDWIAPELLHLRGTNADTMRKILSIYNIDENNIHIIPWQNPISSYLGVQWIISEGESLEEMQKDYVNLIRDMLFGK